MGLELKSQAHARRRRARCLEHKKDLPKTEEGGHGLPLESDGSELAGRVAGSFGLREGSGSSTGGGFARGAIMRKMSQRRKKVGKLEHGKR